MSKKKTATDGERLELRWLRRVNGPVSLFEFRTLDDFANERVAAKAHDRAIDRAVRKERARCVGLVVKARDGSRYAGFTMQTISRLLCDMEEFEQ